MKRSIPRVAGLAAVLALSLPVAASAHPGVYTVTQKVAGAGIVYPNAAGLTDRTQYVVANDGYAVGFTETAGSGSLGGMVNYKVMPTTYRADMTEDQKRTYAPAQTNLQPHATCEGVPALDPTTGPGGARVVEWQHNGPGFTNNTANPPVPVADPYFNYVPWQKTGVTIGADTNLLGENPAFWIPVVKSATDGLPGAPAGGVDLSALSTVQQFTDACTALGGTYKKADAASAIANSLIANAVAPLQSQVTSLTGQLTTAQGQATTLQGQLAALQGEKDTLAAAKAAAEDAAAQAEASRAAGEKRQLTLTLAATRVRTPSVVALTTGPVGASATVSLRLTQKRTTALGLDSPQLATVTKPIGAQGALLVTLSPGAAQAAALAKAKGNVALIAEAATGGQTRTAVAILAK